MGSLRSPLPSRAGSSKKLVASRHSEQKRQMARPQQETIGIVLRLPGMVAGAWVFVPFAIAWIAALGLSTLAGRESRPELLPFTIGLYGCVAFFTHAYSLGWRTGSIVWRYLSLFIAILLLLALTLLHLDDSEARVLYPQGALVQRGADARYQYAAGLCGTAAALLIAHGFLLGLGSRIAPKHKPPRRRLRLRRHRDAEPHGDPGEEQR